MKIENPFSLDGKTALVAGASRGIGLAIARQVAAAGARTLMAARSLDQLEKHAGELRDAGLQAEALPLDVADPESVSALAGRAGAVDILIAVAGTNARQRFEDYTPDVYGQIMQTNLHGIFALTQKIGAGMIARGKGGKMVMIGSLTSLLGLPYVSVYAMTKSALAGMTRSLAAEWGQYEIQVNCIAPGFVLTDLNRKMWESPELQTWLKGVQPNPRMGTPEDIAPLAVFLSGRGSDYVTGQVIAVDGGHSTTVSWPFQP
jgi:NAD(P)-dependent dehydrogenase (short-subunit alcohol dehydrogenase family)